ncbi:hypothetical protein EJ04DRAFT_495911 [Polyplosphaeria fusca]|uniref:Carrier domain-containing protein n=1 Tax=Polyplosphaeria fusca TaxID=682080 RepID=A0A9P4V293_9PLEO|nr:hypothetical protein EJ04DRAFT_495911 [Polyplosphaeria fusca]
MQHAPIAELSILNRHPTIINGPGLLHDLVQRSPSPKQPAIDFLEDGSKRRTLSYASLHALSDGLAGTIAHAMARLKHASSIVPVYLPQSPELYIALLAILKAGKAFCSLHLDTPPDRLKFILNDLSAGILLTTSSQQAKLPSLENVKALLIDGELSKETNPTFPTALHTCPKDIAYVLYTSGSTGLPKAVQVSHGAATQSLLAQHRLIPDFSRFLQFASPTFDVSIFEIFFPWLRGKTVVGCNRARMLDDLPDVIRDMEIDAAELTPTVASNLLHGRNNVPGLKLLLTIGEMLTRHVIDEFGASDKNDGILWGMYGPTEAAIHCALQASFQTKDTAGCIGIPFETVSAFIARPLSPHQDPSKIEILPTGEIGELIVGGPQIAEGYLQRPEINAAAFFEHPDFGPLYRTGDKARVLPDGRLECLGRMTSGQIKIRGQRVELGEVESAIVRTEGCYAAAVIVDDNSLVAFCAVSSNATTKEDILESCKRWLPSYMVPSKISFVSQMPQLASGKIDRKALETQHHESKQISREEESDTALDENGLSLVSVVSKTLQQPVASHSLLSSVGLDSLRSIQIASSLREQGYNLSAVDVLSVNTCRELVELCQTKKGVDTTDRFSTANQPDNMRLDVPEFQDRLLQITEIIPCSPIQEAMLSETVSRSGAYCNWIEVEILQPCGLASLQRAIHTLANDNEILRSGFHIPSTSGNFTFVQIVWNSLLESQISEVTHFTKSYSLSSPESFLRPFQVQVNFTQGLPRLLFHIHHALYDGWSFDLMLRDLDDVLAGRKPKRRPQYREIVRYLATAPTDKSRDYWRNLLSDYSQQPLPNFNGRVLRQSRRCSKRGVSAVNSTQLFERATAFSVNPQVFFQAATVLMIGAYTGSHDIVIGTVTSGRTIPVSGIEAVFGPCLASLPLRVDISKCITAKALLEQIQAANRAMLAHSTIPLRNIAKNCSLQPHTQLFDVLFVWQQSLFSNEDRGLGVHITDSEDDLEFKITLEFEPREDSISYKLTYDNAFISDAQIAHLCRQIDDLVIGILQEAEEPLTTTQRCFTLESLSIGNPYPKQEHFSHGPAHAVEMWSMQSPEAQAVVLGARVNDTVLVQEVLTYANLNRRANKLARAIQEHQSGKDQLICVVLEKSIHLYISILAILKTGAGYLPIVPGSPSERLRKILVEANVQICVTDHQNAEQIPRQDGLTIIEVDKTDLSAHSEKNLDVQYNGSHLAYAVFTSGSTGAPKGVLVTQDNLMSNLAHLKSIYPTPKGSRMLQACSQAFDVSIFEIFFSWYTGMCLCTATKEDLFDNLEHAINQLSVTHLSLTPTVASLVDPSHVPKVQFLVTAGEALTEHVRRQWAGKGLYQGYGPSETTNICTVRAAVTANDLINNIGAPFRNTSVFVLNPENENIVPRGAIGELCFGGEQVFRGYLNMPELNAQKIINHPDFGRVYRSGDMGRLLPDNAILFTGRYDDQVKVRGHRIELGEVTSNVLDCAGVEDCVTLLVNQSGTSRHLVTFWVPTSSGGLMFEVLNHNHLRSTISRIYQSLSLQIPVYMVPSHLVPISRIPFTSQTKVDSRLLRAAYKALSAEFLDSVSLDPASINASVSLSENEKSIAHALAETLQMSESEVGQSTSFFTLGLDSISAIRFSNLLRTSGIASVSSSDILRNPTVARLAVLCKSAVSMDSSAHAAYSSVTDVFSDAQKSHIQRDLEMRGLRMERILPCTPLQEGMLSQGSSSRSYSYCNTMVFRVHGQMSRLQMCWAEMIKRHEILRTTFVPTDNSRFAYAQVVLSHHEPGWEHLEPNKFTPHEDAISRHLDDFKPPFTLGTRKSKDAMHLVFSCHHALYDATAISVLLGEIEAVYRKETLPPVVPYERVLRHMLSQDVVSADRYWALILGDVEPHFFPDVTGKTTHRVHETSTSSKTLDCPLSKAKSFCQENAISLLALVQAAWTKILYFCIGEEDVCFGNVVGGRTAPEEGIERLVAPCFNTIPVRLQFDFSGSNSDLIQKLHNLNLESLPFQSTPLRRIQQKFCRHSTRLFDTLVILQQPSNALDETIWALEEDLGHTDIPIVCEIVQDTSSDHLVMKLHHSITLLSAQDANLLAKIFERSFSSCVQFPQCAAKDTIGFPSTLLSGSNLSPTVLSVDETPLLHSAMEQNASQLPHHMALDFLHTSGNRTKWTFQDLNIGANQIAHALLERGVCTEDIVPVHIAKSPQFYASILGVLKSGAAFVPVHPDLPLARKQLMLSEIRPKAVVSTAKDTCDWYQEALHVDVDTLTQYSTKNPSAHRLTSTNLAYCLYTSGSTGLPKAVSMEHRAPTHTITASGSLIPWKHNSRLLQYAATTFDMCYYDCFLAWSFGFTLCAAEQDTMLNDIVAVVRELNVSLLDLTPSVASSITRTSVPSVEWLYCIGEAMTPGIVSEWEGACVNSYGPTEAAFCTTILPVRHDLKSTIIGRPFQSTSFAVFSRNDERMLPVLGIGELYIGGAQLAREYLGRPELTEQQFVHCNGKRFYKTGDIVRMLRDGNFEFIGRADEQVKIRGLRVELGEVSHVLEGSHEHIRAVTTQILKKSKQAKPQLVAFFEPSTKLDNDENRALKLAAEEAAIANLPSYMVPQHFIKIDRIPRSLAGKVDRKALAEIFSNIQDGSSKDGDTTVSAELHQWTEREEFIRDVFARLSQSPLREIGPTTSIYQLGLDSISAVQIAAALRKHGLVVTAVDVLKHTSCVELAEHISQSLEKVGKDFDFDFDFQAFHNRFAQELSLSELVHAGDIEAILPCTLVQQGILSQFISSGGHLYFNYIRFELRAKVRLQEVKQAWRAAVQSHPILRTGFTSTKDKKNPFVMIRYQNGAIQSPWEDIPEAESSNSVDDWIRLNKSRALDDLQQPPWRIRAVEEDGHVFLDMVMLHTLFDAQSLRVIFTDVLCAYRGQKIPRGPPIEPVLARMTRQTASNISSSEDFWKRYGKNVVSTRFPNLAPLRFEAAPPSVLTKRCVKSPLELLSGCKKANISLQTAGLASWAALLSAYTGESSITFGMVLSGRNFEDAESVVFPCITTVPFACKVDGDQFRFLKEVARLNADVQANQFTPLTDISRLMGFADEAMFDSIFSFLKLSEEDASNDLWTVVDESASADYPLSIELELHRDHLDFRLTYLPHVIPQGQASLILDQLDHLLCQYVDPDTANTGRNTFEQLLYSIAAPKQPILPSNTMILHELIELSMTRNPDAIALEFADAIKQDKYNSKCWTYSDLDKESNRVAHLIISQNVKPGELVGICFDKCPEASFATLGILRAGCAFVALDPDAPDDRKAFIITDSEAKVVLTMRKYVKSLSTISSSKILGLDSGYTRTLPTSKPTLERKVESWDRCYCLYTSGTTGTPKGCEITHENVVQALLSFERLFSGHWDQNSRWFQFASFHFDVSVLEQYWSWYVGIRVVSAPRDLLFEDLPRSLRVLGITHIDLTPSLARIVQPEDVPSLAKGVFITGGESLKQEILDVWGPKAVIYNGYGPTEATIGVTMSPRVPTNGKPSNIGLQFDNVGSFVLKPGSDIPVFRGAVGELCVTGKLVGKGYLNRPELTKERFPYLDRFGERVYRTGDLVRMLHDGSFEFLGRADDQVKLRGQRLEVGEINSVIKRSVSTCLDVATLILKHPKQQKDQLVSFMVVAPIASDEPKSVLKAADEAKKAKNACLKKLPTYMVPTHFVPLTALPLSTNNKADARKLKAMYEALSVADLQLLSSTESDEEATWTAGERKMCRVLADLLELSEAEIGKHTSFFELGLDSISAIGLTASLKQAGFSKAAASMVMKHSTISRLDEVLSIGSSSNNDRGSIIAAQQFVTAIQHRHRRDVAEALMFDAREIEFLVPCTSLQQGMIARSMNSNDGLYFNTFQFRLSQTVALDKLEEAWYRAYKALPILRTVFANTEDGHVQAIRRNGQFPWKSYDLPEGQLIEEHIAQLRSEWLQQNQKLLKKPFELVLVATPDYTLLAVHIFHALYDGTSIQRLFTIAYGMYNGSWDGETGPPFHEVLPYGPLRSPSVAKDFWRKEIVNHDPKASLSDYSITDTTPLTFTRRISGLSAFGSIRQKLKVTPQAMAQACWAYALHKYSKDKVCIGVVVSGRGIDYEGADRVIGPLFNTIPYIFDPGANESLGSMVKKTHEFNVAAHTYQHTPLRDILKWCKRKSSEPLFDNLFVYQVASTDNTWKKNDAWELLDEGAEADYPLALEVEHNSDDSLTLTMVIQGVALAAEISTQLLDEFERTLKMVLENPSTVMETYIAEGRGGSGGADNDSSDRPPAETGDSGDVAWGREATAIKEEIAELTSVENGSITQRTSILELGLDSIDAIKLSSRLKKRGINLPVSGIMRSLTITNMTKHISGTPTPWTQQPSSMIFNSHKRRLWATCERRGISLKDVESVLPLTPLQEGMVAEMVASKYTKYYNHDVLELAPATDIVRLRRAWNEVVKKSPILRTSFVQIDDTSVDFAFAQVINRSPHAFWKAIADQESPNFSEVFDSIRGEVARSSGADPLFHIRILKSGGAMYLILSIAHALYDGWSLGLLHADVQRAYSKSFKPRPSYEIALRNILTMTGVDALSFWRDFLTGANTSAFPRRAIADSMSLQPVHREERSSRLGLGDLISFAKKHKVSLQALGQAVFAFVLASYVHSLDVTFGSILSGRDDNAITNVLFPTMSTVAIRTILHGTRREMLQYVQENSNQVKLWQHFPLRRAQALSGVQGSLFESLFIYQKRMEEQGATGVELYHSIAGQSEVEYPVCVEMEIVGEVLLWRCAVKDEVFDLTGTHELLGRLDDVLENLLSDTDVPSIDITPEGISVCGLPPFRTESDAKDESSSLSKPTSQANSESATAKAIREVLSFVSKTPEDEITKGMTIFHIGLDSISAIKASSLLHKRGIQLAVGEMLKAGTVEKMALIVDERAPSSQENTPDTDTIINATLKEIDRESILHQIGIEEVHVEGVLPATAGQTYMLSAWLNAQGTNFYPEFRYRLEGSISVDSLRMAWKALVMANPILRISFAATVDNTTPFVQIILCNPQLQTFFFEDKKFENAKLERQGARQPYLSLFASKSLTGWDMRLQIHHALYDGVSLPLLMHQLQDLCNGSEPLSIPEVLPTLIASCYTPSACSNRKSFWTQYLNGIDPHLLSRRPSPPTHKIEIYKPRLLPSISRLHTLSRKHGLTMQSLFLAIIAKLYASLTSTPPSADIVIGIYLANRSHPLPHLATAPIPTLNIVPLRVSAPQDIDLTDVAAQIQYDVQEMSSTQNACVSLWEIDLWTGVKIDICVNFLTLPDSPRHEASVESVVIEPVGMWEEGVSRVVPLEHGHFEVPRELEAASAHVTKSYLHAVDIEATISGGAMDVGFFAPEEMVGLSEGERFIEEVQAALEGFLEEGEIE